MSQLFLKVIACEIAFREICYAAAHSSHVVDLELLHQGLHDNPHSGVGVIQERIDAVPPGKYGAILVGYALCGNLIVGLRATHTRLIIPRAHDCIAFFLGSVERCDRLTRSHPGAYYYTSGWLECVRRRGGPAAGNGPLLLPTRGGFSDSTQAAYEDWVKKYGEERARYLAQVMDQWTTNYTHGVLIDFEFSRLLHLREQVQRICDERGWVFKEVGGDLRLLQRWLDGEWDPNLFLTVAPGEKVTPSYDGKIMGAEPVKP